MKAIRPLKANMVYKRPPSRPDILDLHCVRVEPGLIRTEWRLGPDEFQFLLAGGNIELDIHGEPIPPVALNVTEPFCPECAVTMVMELSENGDVPFGPSPPDSDLRPAHWHFRCPNCRRWA